MKNLLIISLLLVSCSVLAQEPFNDCAAVFLNEKMIVEKYDTDSKPKVPINAQGELTAATVELGENHTNMVDKISFAVAIKDKNTHTIMLFSTKSYTKFRIEDALKLCKKGDWIIILTTKDTYSLPHNEILVE